MAGDGGDFVTDGEAGFGGGGIGEDLLNFSAVLGVDVHADVVGQGPAIEALERHGAFLAPLVLLGIVDHVAVDAVVARGDGGELFLVLHAGHVEAGLVGFVLAALGGEGGFDLFVVVVEL